MKRRKPTHYGQQSRTLELEGERGRLRALQNLRKGFVSCPEEFRVLTESMNDGLVVSNDKTLVTYVNSAFCRMLGYEAEEIIGRHATDFLDEESKALLSVEIKKRQMGQTSRYRKTFLTKDGRRIPASVLGTPTIDENGRYKGSFAVVKDLTEAERIIEELENKSKEIVKVNTALHVLLERRALHKEEFGDQVMSNVKLLIEPYLEKLRAGGLDKRQEACVKLIQKNLSQIVSPFAHKLSAKHATLTPAEIRVADLGKQGMRTKEIAALLNLSTRTVSFHRENIRRKLGIKEKNENLTFHLVSLE